MGDKCRECGKTIRDLDSWFLGAIPRAFPQDEECPHDLCAPCWIQTTWHDTDGTADHIYNAAWRICCVVVNYIALYGNPQPPEPGSEE
jgi:hypothetical protein